jgi:hypothetical protein
MIDSAVTEPLLWYQLNQEWDWHSKRSGAALMLLMATATHDPNYLITDGTAVKERILEHFRNVIKGGKEPGCSGGLDTSAINQVIQAFAIAKMIPEIWDELTQLEKDNITIIVEACLIASHWAHDDDNEFNTGINQLGNFGKNWNSNMIEGGIGMGIAATYYLGGAVAANDILLNFNYDDFMARVKNAGLTSIDWVFNQTGKTGLEAATQDNFTYNGYPLDQLFYWLKNRAELMYSKPAASTGADGKGYIQCCSDTLPNHGLMGMAQEFDAVDAGGGRSHIGYVADGWLNSLSNRFTLEHLNGWGTGPDQESVEARYDIGTTDFIYKAVNGYYNHAKGEEQGLKYEKDIDLVMGYFFMKELWEKYYQQ